MNHKVRPWRRPVARALVLALALGSAPVCLAGEPPGPQQSQPTLAASIEKAVQHELGAEIAKAPADSTNVARQATSTQSTHSSFFKSRTGVITVVLLAAGTGFALYSTSHDRVKSPQVTYGGTWK